MVQLTVVPLSASPQILELHQLVRQLQDGVASIFRCGACVGRFALDLQHHGVDAVGGGGYRVAIRRFVGENVIMLAGEFGDQCL